MTPEEQSMVAAAAKHNRAVGQVFERLFERLEKAEARVAALEPAPKKTPARRRGQKKDTSAMRIRTEKATAAQLRQYAKEKLGIDMPPTTNRANALRILQDAGEAIEEIVLSDDPAPVDPADEGAKAAALPPAAAGDRTAMLVAALVEQGMDEGEARVLAGETMSVEASRRELPTGEEAAKLWCTIRLARTEEAGGDEPVPVGLNGSVQLIPRGEDVPVRLPYVEILRHAQKIIYTTVPEADGLRLRYVPHIVPRYPIESMSAPFPEAHARKLLAEREAARQAA